MSDPLIKISDRAEFFIASLEEGDENEWVRGLGIPGPYKKKHFRRALREGLMVVHPSGKGLAWAYAAAVEKVERVFNYEDHKAADPEATKRLLADFKRMQFGLAPKKEVLALPAHEAIAAAIDWDL